MEIQHIDFIIIIVILSLGGFVVLLLLLCKNRIGSICAKNTVIASEEFIPTKDICDTHV